VDGQEGEIGAKRLKEERVPVRRTARYRLKK
jgi:hypothetical protein